MAATARTPSPESEASGETASTNGGTHRGSGARGGNQGGFLEEMPPSPCTRAAEAGLMGGGAGGLGRAVQCWASPPVCPLTRPLVNRVHIKV